ncbi:hypothetical protein ACWDE0_33680 [Streptomyces sp. 900105755]|uniref:hypothetical protein n=1 Tax=unclassified Streptomyces TaxID=2593676 RepID=UPI000898479F|nr:hypothetical protein [Streptomyces sp. Ag109_O5-10]SEF02978.1 hypothetical protein SAMN05216533_5335 [Streptomyces sp. Ag109_O5-10]
MRRTTFHRTSLAAASLLLLAACGSQSGSGNNADKGGGTVSTAPSASSSGVATRCVSVGELTAADNGSTYCMTVGGQLRLSLDGTRQRPWKAVTASGSALRAANAGIVLQPGDASAAYEAVAPGTVTLSSTRPLCAQPTAPGGVSCKGIQEWRVTVKVN